MAKREDLMLDLLKELRIGQKEHSEILGEMKSDVTRNADDLQEHMEQTRAVKELTLAHHKEADSRLTKLEEPRIAFKLIKKYVIGIGGLAGSTLAILRLLDII